ncbi:MAG: outer membrane lipoprotein-sorting protein [Spirochaetales bacterium]|nr:outer membrane lipoprotein-sorting protein [Spirochaetales bacterium]
MKKKLIAVSIFCLIVIAAGFSQANRGAGIAKKTFELLESNDDYSLITMVLIDKRGNKKTRKFKMYSKQGSRGRDSFIEFVEPADVKGTKFLTIARKNADDEQRLYLPALGKVRKIASSKKDGEFMGSDLFYYDMEDRDYEEFTYNYVGEEVFRGMNCYVVESFPKDSSAPYSKMVMWVNKDNYFVYKRDCYDSRQQRRLLKSIIVLEVKNTRGVLTGTKMVIENHLEDHKTLLERDNLYVNTGIDDSVFSVQNLTK